MRLRLEPEPVISVLIATYDRPALLASCLSGFSAQTMAPDLFEIIVVDDGSSGSATADTIEAGPADLHVRWCRIDHRGRSAAKNMAILLARGRIVLFFDDDDRPSPTLLEHHVDAHHEFPNEATAILGHTDWAPELTISPLMHFLTEVDQILFSYGSLTDGQALDWRGFWEGRLSCKRWFLLRHGLHDERLEYSIDVELGYRLAAHGLEVRYKEAARSIMVRPVTLDDFCRRCEGKGRAHAVMASLHPNPEVQRYAKVTDVGQRWERGQALLGPLVSRARVLEASLEADWHGHPLLEELYGCYRAIFEIHTAKGASEELDRLASTRSAPGVEESERHVFLGQPIDE